MKNFRIWALAVLMLSFMVSLSAASDYAQYYTNLPFEMEQVQAVVIPDYTVVLTDFGGVGDGETMCTEAFANAIKHLRKQGGGHLIVPEGIWLTGPIQLRSNIDLHLNAGAVVRFSSNRELYVQPSDTLRDGSKKCYALLRASKCENIAITGQGTLDGQGIYWRPVKSEKVDEEQWNELLAMGGVVKPNGKTKNIWYPFNLNKELGVPNIASDPITQEKMRPHLVNITDSKNVLIEGVRLLNSPKFHLVPTRVQNLIIDGVNIRCPHWAQNGDAMDPGNVQVALIVNCNIACGDDGICMKGGVGQKGVDAGPQRDFLIMNDTVYHAHGGFVIGSEFSGGMQRLVVRNCMFDGTDIGLRMKSAPGRGGWCEDIYCSDIVMRNIKDAAIYFESGYADRGAGESATDKDNKEAFFPDWSHFTFKDITCVGTKTAVEITGMKGKPVHDLLFDGVTILNAKNGLVLKFAENLTFKGCTIRARNENDIQKSKQIIYNGKDLLEEE